MRGAPFILGGASLMSGCLGLLGGDGVPNPIDAGSGRDAASDHHGRESSASHEAGEAGKPAGAAVTVSSGSNWQDWCAVTANGDVECWGDNALGELGDGTTTSSATPAMVKGLPEAELVSVGYAFVCALTKSSGVWCWGRGSEGQLGNGGSALINRTPKPVTGLGTRVISLSANVVACAVKQDGSVWCWGDGSDTNLLGNGQTTDARVPVAVPGLRSGVTSVSVGARAACAVQRGSVLCWGGFDFYGELGNGTTNASPTPVPVEGLPGGITSVSVGSDYVCALTAGGAVECWGDGMNGALGNHNEAISPAPVQVSGLTSGVTAISTGYYTACALEQHGKIVCWGFGGDGELGHGPLTLSGGALNPVSTVPVPVKGLSGPATSLSTGTAPCAVTTTGRVECWGVTAENTLTPVPVPGLEVGASSVTLGGAFSSTAFACAVDGFGAVECWGGNDYGQLGNTTTLDSAFPVYNYGIATGSTGVAASASGNFACGIESGLVICWGANVYGQLGNGTTTTSPVSKPVAVVGLSGVAAVTAGASFACALMTAGGAYCWGDNTYGQLGNNSRTSSSVPVPVQGLTSGVAALSAGWVSTCALLQDGTVDCWGDGASGQLGNGSTAVSPAPGPVPGLSGVTAISVGWVAVCAVTSGGAVECWGDNTFGEFGNGTTNSSLVPVLSGVTSGASGVAVGQTSACAIVGGGATCWGNGGALGLDTFGLVVTPTPVRGLTAGVTEITVGIASACALLFGGVECWGTNTAGQLGNGGAVDDFQATPVPGFP